MADNNKKHIIVCGKGGGGSGTQVQADWNETDSTSPAYINNKPTGLGNEWWGTQAEYDAIPVKDPDTVYHIEGSETVDWDNVTDKPTFASVATSGDYTDLSNTPTIPTVNNSTITLTQGGATKGSFTLNQGSNSTINLDAGGAELRGLHTTPTSNTITLACSVDQTSVLEFKFIYTQETSDNFYIGDYSFRTFYYYDTIFDDINNGRQTYNPDMSSHIGHIISVTQSNTYLKWYDETTGETIVEANDTVTTDTFSFSNMVIKGDFNWTLISAKLTTQNSVEFDLSVDEDGLYDAVAADYVTLNGYWENVLIDGSVVYWNDVKYKPTFAPVATTGNYSDLTNKPAIPVAPTLPLMTTETLTFTLANNTTVTLKVYVQPDVTNLDYFYVEDASGSDNTVNVIDYGGGAIEVFKSTDKLNWTSMGVTSDVPITATIPANGKLYLKANTNAWGNGDGRDSIYCTASFNIGGNIMSLLEGDNFTNATLDTSNSWQFRQLFDMWGMANVVDASDLVLPSNTAPYCYYNMFAYNGFLTAAPVLPATTLTEGCYALIFNSCSSLDSVTTYANDNSASNCTADWLTGVAASGDLYNLGSATYTADSPSGIPSGWTEHTSL